MIDNEELSCKTLEVLSKDKSTNNNNGSAVIHGGLGVCKNVYVKDELIAEELISKKNTKIGGDL